MLSFRAKKVLLIIAFIFLVVVLGYGLYYFFFRAREEPAAVPSQELAANQLPLAGIGAPTPTIEGPVGLGGLPSSAEIPTLAPPSVTPAERQTTILREAGTRAISMQPGARAVRFYNPDDGKFYRLFDDASIGPLSNTQFFNVDKVDWGNSTDKAVMSFPDGSNIVYDFKADKSVTLPKHWEDFNFSPDDNQIIAKSVGVSETNRFLIIADANGGNVKAIEELGRNQDKVHSSWSPNNQIVAYSFTGDPLGVDREAVVLLGKNQENFKNLIVGGRGFVPNWSPSGEQLLYSAWSEKTNFRPTLWISGANGDNINDGRRNLNLFTWADKCAWKDEMTLICAVPSNLPGNAGLQRELFDQGLDYIYRVDLRSNSRINLGQPDGIISVGQISIPADGSVAYVTDKKTGKLARFNLE